MPGQQQQQPQQTWWQELYGYFAAGYNKGISPPAANTTNFNKPPENAVKDSNFDDPNLRPSMRLYKTEQRKENQILHDEPWRKAIIDRAMYYNNGGKSRIHYATGASLTSDNPSSLDCGGFMRQVLEDVSGAGHGGKGMAESFGFYPGRQLEQDKIDNKDDLKPGDLAFMMGKLEKNGKLNKLDANHVAMYIGRDENMEPMFVHSNSAGKGVTVTHGWSMGHNKANGESLTFTQFRRIKPELQSQVLAGMAKSKSPVQQASLSTGHGQEERH